MFVWGSGASDQQMWTFVGIGLFWTLAATLVAPNTLDLTNASARSLNLMRRTRVITTDDDL